MANFTKSLDPNRPITAAIAVPVNEDKAAQFLDIISFNRYNGWYSNPGRVDMITQRVVDEAIAWNTKHKKPVLMSEYGADTVEGLHFVSMSQIHFLSVCPFNSIFWQISLITFTHSIVAGVRLVRGIST